MTDPDPTWFGHDPWWLVLAKALGVFVFLLLTVLSAILIERKILGRMQLRSAPTGSGPYGLLQSLADGVKLALKEGLIPAGVDKWIYLAGTGHLGDPGVHGVRGDPDGPGGVGVRPPHRAAADRPAGRGALHPGGHLDRGLRHRAGRLGIRFDLSAAGRAALLRAGDLLRDRHGAVFAAVFIYSGTMSTSGIVAAQDDTWFVFLLLPSFLVYLTSMVGETNRAPFDLPEAEGELVGGFHTEYSSLKFAMFMLAEYVNMTTVSALATTLFLGGWRAPLPISLWEGANSGWWPLLWFTAKVWLFLFVFIWLRATLPRLRYDQFMGLGWKLLIPVSLAWIMIVATTRTLRSQGYQAWATALIGAGVAVVARRRVELLHAENRPDHRRPRHRTPAADAGGFPVPPMPTKPEHEQPRARCLVPRCRSPDSASRSDRCSRSRSPRSTRKSPDRSRRAITGGISSTAMPTAWRNASAASCAPGPARPTPSSSRAPTTPTTNGTRPVSVTGGSTRSTICAASAADCASRRAPPGR